jgi:hypothetical protein
MWQVWQLVWYLRANAGIASAPETPIAKVIARVMSVTEVAKHELVLQPEPLFDFAFFMI